MPDKITTAADGSLQVSDEPIIPFIEGDGTGVDIWPAAQKVMDAAAAKHGKKIAWKEVLAGQKAYDETGSWLPDETVDTFKEYLIGIKPVSETGSKRLIRAAIEYAVSKKRKSVTLVHKGNIQKFTEGAFRSWGYELTREEFSDVAVGWDDCDGKPGDKVLVKDAIADITLQQVLTRADEFDVIATTNLNGDYISDAVAAQVGGIGIAPGGNINYVSGHSIFEATHGTAPKYAGQDKVNPGSVLLSGVLMFERLGWQSAADDIVRALEATIAERIVTYDFAGLMGGATEVKTSEFASAIVDRL